jgi:two-component system C4-dicarboxylate transport response regulator DctD
LADEDLADLMHYSAILSHLGYEVRAFACYGEAAACLGEEIFDLVVVSQGTPNFEGRCVLVRAIAQDRHTPVLVLTQTMDIPCYLEAMQLGAHDYLEKPLPVSEIAALVRRHLRTPSGTA